MSLKDQTAGGLARRADMCDALLDALRGAPAAGLLAGAVCVRLAPPVRMNPARAAALLGRLQEAGLVRVEYRGYGRRPYWSLATAPSLVV